MLRAPNLVMLVHTTDHCKQSGFQEGRGNFTYVIISSNNNSIHILIIDILPIFGLVRSQRC
jgi:hypothetical protein